VIETLNKEINKITQSADITARLSDLGVYPRQDSVEGAREFFVSQQKAMKKIVADLGIQAQ
jgi:tripartite-type tricarboxylate transporter receptor subunit TctC